MWMEELKNGKFKYIERYTEPYTNKTKRKSIVLTSDKKRAQNEANRTLQKMISDEIEKINKQKEELELGYIENEKTFEEMANLWYYEYVHKNPFKEPKGSTIGTYAYNLETLLSKYMLIEKEYLIKNINHEVVQDVYERIITEYKLSYNYAKHFRAIIRGAFKTAYKYKYIRNLDAIDLSAIPVKAKSAKELESDNIPLYLEKDEYYLFIEIAYRYNNEYAQVCELLYANALRIGELLALTKEDWDGGDFINIYGTYDNNPKSPTRFQKVTPKTKKSFRRVQLSERSKEILTERIYLNDLLFGDEWHFLFITDNMLPYDVGTLNKFIYARQEDAGIETKMHTHIFRHTHISMLAELGVPLLVIMERVGHEDREITEKIYTHVTRKQNDDLAAKLELL